MPLHSERPRGCYDPSFQFAASAKPRTPFSVATKTSPPVQTSAKMRTSKSKASAGVFPSKPLRCYKNQPSKRPFPGTVAGRFQPQKWPSPRRLACLPVCTHLLSSRRRISGPTLYPTWRRRRHIGVLYPSTVSFIRLPPDFLPTVTRLIKALPSIGKLRTDKNMSQA